MLCVLTMLCEVKGSREAPSVWRVEKKDVLEADGEQRGVVTTARPLLS